jgi:hypothetical protein
MPIFGQVWLWSSLAFLLGALLCWLLVARPARNRVGELEAQLTTRARHQSAQERPEPPRYRSNEDSLVPGLSRRDDAEQTHGYGMRDTPPPLPPERDRLAPYADQEPNRDFQSPRPLESEPFGFSNGLSAPPETDTELADPSRSAATQYLDVSSGSLTAPPEVPSMSPPPSDRGWFDDELEGDAANQAPEEQPAVPRNRHHMVEPEEYEPFDARLVDDEDTGIHDAAEESPRSAIDQDDDGGTVFTQRTHPIPGELIRQIDEAGKEELARSESHQDDRADSYAEPSYADSLSDTFADSLSDKFSDSLDDKFADNLVDDLADDPAEPEADRRERTVDSEAVAPPADSEAVFTPPEELESPEEAVFPPSSSLNESPEPTDEPELPQEQTEVVAAVKEEAPDLPPPANDLPRRVPQANRISQGVSVRVEPTPTATSALPKRVPGKPRHQVPFGVMPGTTPEPVAAAPAMTVDEPESPRSLFEPIVPATDEGTSTPPPPHRLRQGSGGGRGPFGPGSAMPLPGGASPSPEFTIKASVAALRYCTPESPQFGRTVAEVWFRTAADAERVGFRPVG